MGDLNLGLLYNEDSWWANENGYVIAYNFYKADDKSRKTIVQIPSHTKGSTTLGFLSAISKRTLSPTARKHCISLNEFCSKPLLVSQLDKHRVLVRKMYGILLGFLNKYKELRQQYLVEVLWNTDLYKVAVKIHRNKYTERD